MRGFCAKCGVHVKVVDPDDGCLLCGFDTVELIWNIYDVACPTCSAQPNVSCTADHYNARRTKYFVVTGCHRGRFNALLRAKKRHARAKERTLS